MKSSRVLIAVVVLLLTSLPAACWAGFTGSLSSTDGGISGTGGWMADPVNKPVTLSWSVTQTGSYWFYQYTFTLDEDIQGSLSHWIIEVSPNVEHGEIIDAVPSIQVSDPQLYMQQGGNPSMPGNIFGIKFEAEDSESSWTASFYTQRNPVWGDFYAKNGRADGQGQFNTAWNAGFLADDPIAPAADGSVNCHLLVPDTTTPVIPAPGAVMLAGIGVICARWLRRHRMF